MLANGRSFVSGSWPHMARRWMVFSSDSDLLLTAFAALESLLLRAMLYATD